MVDIRIRVLVATLSMAVTCAACAKAPRVRPVKEGAVETGKGTLGEARKYLEGRWTLLSLDIFPAEGAPVRVQGSGTLIYDDYGNLTMDVQADDASVRALERSGIRTTPGAFSSKGRTVVDLQSRTLTYVLESAPPPALADGPLALSRPRHWQVEGSVLTLTTRRDDGRPLAVGRWQKQ
jgi:hypothetical protein